MKRSIPKQGTIDGNVQTAKIRTYESVAEVLSTFSEVMHAIAVAGGPRCEVVLHDLSGDNVDLGHTIVAIEHGEVTGRKVGGPSSNLGANVLSDQDANHNAFGYSGFTDDGRELRCSSVYFKNAAGKVIAALCINFDISGLQHARSLIDALLPVEPGKDGEYTEEFIGHDLSSMLDTMITDAIRRSGKPVAQMNRDDRIAILERLESQGALRMRKAMDSITTRLGISRVTGYSYLDEIHTRPNP